MKKETKELINKNSIMMKFCSGNNYYLPDNYNPYHNHIEANFQDNERHKYMSAGQQEACVVINDGKFYIHSWSVSGHNGDTYGDEKVEITEDEYIMFAKRASESLFSIIWRLKNKSQKEWRRKPPRKLCVSNVRKK